MRKPKNKRLPGHNNFKNTSTNTNFVFENEKRNSDPLIIMLVEKQKGLERWNFTEMLEKR